VLIESTASDSQLPQRPCLSNSTGDRQSIHHQRFMSISLLKNLIFLGEYILNEAPVRDHSRKAPFFRVRQYREFSTHFRLRTLEKAAIKRTPIALSKSQNLLMLIYL
jgi:hypothetical protein